MATQTLILSRYASCRFPVPVSLSTFRCRGNNFISAHFYLGFDAAVTVHHSSSNHVTPLCDFQLTGAGHKVYYKTVMKRNMLIFRPFCEALAIALFLVSAADYLQADSLQLDNAKIKVKPRTPFKAYAFDLRDVRLLSGPFKHAMELDREYLLSIEPDRLLHTFRLNAGLPSSAQPYGGWEEPNCELRGHFTGHYLSACALMYASTGDERLKQKAAAVVAGLAECQNALKNGYLSAYPESFIDRVENQQRVWAPYYTLHKIFAGLQDVYVYCDNQQALAVVQKFADWALQRNSRLSDEQMQKMLGNEHGGMNETLANLFALTGNPDYLKLSLRFNHRAVLDPLSRGEDRLTGLHANTQIPKFIGVARQYELTADESLRKTAIFSWETVALERSYVIGGHSDGEMFSPKERLSQALGPATTETCNTYNMLKLTRHLLAWDMQPRYSDFYERALINHILASQNPADGMMCYYVPLRGGMTRGGAPNGYCSPFNSFWCCTGTGIENHAKYGESIYFHDGADNLYLNLFIASELNWRSKQVKVRQETLFPDESSTRLRFYCEKPVTFKLHVRRPFWATTGFAISINGKPVNVDQPPASYIEISRRWQTGDLLEISMPFTLRTEAFRDNPRRFAFLFGPLVLCPQVNPSQPLPMIVAAENEALSSLQPAPAAFAKFAGSPERFRILGQPHGISVTLEPFHKVHGQRPYQVYWDRVSPEEWPAREAEYKEELRRSKELEQRTVDNVIPGNPASEREHKWKGENSSTGQFNGRHYRHATEGGWFEWQLKILKDQPQELMVTYWGSDGGARTFDVLVDGQKIATEKLQNNRPNKFYDQTYPLPPELLANKQNITVRFQAHPGNFAGGVFGCRIMKK